MKSISTRFFTIFSIFFILNLLSGVILLASSPRMLLVEEVTNASCPGCASANPAFNKFIRDNKDKVISIVYHTWFPGANDPFYLEDTQMMRDRYNYYSFSGIPGGRANGNRSFNPGDTSSLRSILNSVDGTNSNVSIKVYAEKSGNDVTLNINVASDVSISSHRLRIAVVEAHKYDTDAGTNGETDFYFTAKEMLPSASGTNFSIQAGKSKNFEEDFTIDNDWDTDNLHVVVFVQNESTKEVLQAERALLSAPSLSSPADEAKNQQTDLTLSWNSVSGVSRYRLYLSEEETLDDPVYEGNVSGTSKQMSGLEAGTRYYWAVKISREYGDNWSKIRSFTTTSSMDISFAPEELCQGERFGITFNTNIDFETGNVFTAQLSDASGNFDNPIDIGTLNGSNGGTISAQIPEDTPAGTDYRVRIVSSAPEKDDSEYQEDITIFALPDNSIKGSISACESNLFTYNAPDEGENTYKWSVTGGSVVGADNQKNVDILWDGPGNGEVTLEITSVVSGCSSQNTLDVTINSLPTPEIQGEREACAYESILYSANTLQGNSFKWSVEGGTIIGRRNQDTARILWEEAGTGTIKLIQGNSNGCSDSIEVNISVEPAPMPEIAGESEVCQSVPIEYSVDDVIGDSYEWTIEGGEIIGTDDESTVEVIWTVAGEGMLEIVQTNSPEGCSNSAMVNVNILPAPAASISGAENTCTNTIEVYVTEGSENSMYIWEVEGGHIMGNADGGSVEIKWGEYGLGKVMLTETYDSGCMMTKEFEVMISDKPDAQINGSETACSTCMETYSTEINDNERARWSAENGTIVGPDNETTVKISWDDTDQGKVMLEVSSPEMECKGMSELVVEIDSSPVPSITGAEAACAGSTEIYSTTSNPDIIKKWQVTGGTIIGPYNESMIHVEWGESTLGTVKIVQSNESIGYLDSLELNIDIMPGPDKPSVSRQGGTLISSADEGNQWYIGGEKIPGATQKEYRPEESGDYAVAVTNTHNCESEMSETYTFDISGVENDESSAIKIWPNPAAGHINVSLGSRPQLDAQIKIVNPLGKSVLDTKMTGRKEKIDLRRLGNGFYLIEIISGGERAIKKLLINK